MENSGRAPIVAVLGHVDHGKTSLLDKIRNTQVQVKEAGGITQKIGASVVSFQNKNITFIDTPGHAAFFAMRSHGATASDIVILVVAADDGVKPQTKEAINLIKEAGVPFIVALTKIDLVTANIESALGQLEKEGLAFEGRGGDIPYVGVSAKTTDGISALLELILLVAEVHGLEGNPTDRFKAVVIETAKTKAGSTVAAVVKAGKLRVGQTIFATDSEVKVRGLFDYLGKSLKEVAAGEPVLILGFNFLPPVGAVLLSEKGENITETAEKKFETQSEGDINIIVKAPSAGSMEAILSNLPDKVKVLGSSVGDVNESDVLMAKSVNAKIFAFEVKVPSSVKKLAEMEVVDVEVFEIIYKLFERLEELIEKGEIKISGRAEIVATFPFNNKKVAGSKIQEGVLNVNERVSLYRGEDKLGEVKIISIKKQKSEVTSVRQGEECGIIFVPQLDFAIGDMLVSAQSQING
jgi:translation initiation factor IF-2